MASEAEKPKEIEHQSRESTSPKKKMFLMAGVALTVVSIGAPLGYFLIRPSEAPKEVEDAVPEVIDAAKEEHSEAEPSEDEALSLLDGEEALGAIVPFDTFLVNLSGGKYLRLQLQAEMETPDVPRRLYGRIVPIRDGIITMLTQKTSADLESSNGKDELKKGIKEFMNEQLRRQEVKRIYFTQFVIQ